MRLLHAVITISIIDSSDSLGRNLGTRLIMSMTCSGVIVVEQNVLLICTLMSWTTEEVLMIELTPHVVPAKLYTCVDDSIRCIELVVGLSEPRDLDN